MVINKTNFNDKPIQKRTIGIDFNESCNLDCKGCPRNYRCSNWTSFDKYLELDEAKKLVDNLIKITNTPHIQIGVLSEFSIYKYNAEILEWINNKYPNIDIIVTTNGTGLTDKFIELLPKLSDRITLNISLWASNKDEYLELHGKDLFDKVIININKIFSLYSKCKCKFMISTVNYSTKQLNGMKSLCETLANKYCIPYRYRTDARDGVSDTFVLHCNVYNGKRENSDIVEDQANFTNDNIGYKCDLITNELYVVYDKLYPCNNILNYIHINDDTLYDDIKNIIKLENTMKECKTCKIGFACLKKGNISNL